MEPSTMDDTDTLEAEAQEPSPEEARKGVLLILAALALMLIPIITGIVLANTGGDPNESSGMTAAPAGDVVTSAPFDAPARPNLALDATVGEVSSEFNENFAASNAIDGSLSTEWSSRGDGDDAYIVIDLGAEQPVTGFGFRTREMTDGTAITESYTVTVDDGDVLGPFEAGVGMSVTDVAVSGQVFRFDMEQTTGGNTGAVEIEIYGG